MCARLQAIRLLAPCGLLQRSNNARALDDGALGKPLLTGRRHPVCSVMCLYTHTHAYARTPFRYTVASRCELSWRWPIGLRVESDFLFFYVCVVVRPVSNPLLTMHAETFLLTAYTFLHPPLYTHTLLPACIGVLYPRL